MRTVEYCLTLIAGLFPPHLEQFNSTETKLISTLFHCLTPRNVSFLLLLRPLPISAYLYNARSLNLLAFSLFGITSLFSLSLSPSLSLSLATYAHKISARIIHIARIIYTSRMALKKRKYISIRAKVNEGKFYKIYI